MTAIQVELFVDVLPIYVDKRCKTHIVTSLAVASDEEGKASDALLSMHFCRRAAGCLLARCKAWLAGCVAGPVDIRKPL